MTTPVIVAYTTFNPVGYQGPGELGDCRWARSTEGALFVLESNADHQVR
jgi:hypothetical protein